MLLIAEIGQAHEGSLGLAHSYIDALAETGVDAVKFQTHIADAESSEYEPFRVNFSFEDSTRMAYWRRMEFTEEQWIGLKNHCDEKGLKFISSPFSNAAVDLLEKVGVSMYKIGSGEVNNYLMLEKIARTGKPIILSSGLSSYEELDKAMSFLNQFENEISLLQCTSAYPTKPEEWGVNVIHELKRRYQKPVGFSDHSGDIYACLAAAASDAEILEFHAVFSKQMFGPDTDASLTIEQIKILCKGVFQIKTAMDHPVDKTENDKFQDLKQIFEKSLAVNRQMNAGEIIEFDDLEAKKPKGFGIDANLYKQVLGKSLRNEKKKWDFLKTEDLK